jgi:hypothetical protein
MKRIITLPSWSYDQSGVCHGWNKSHKTSIFTFLIPPCCGYFDILVCLVVKIRAKSRERRFAEARVLAGQQWPRLSDHAVIF